MIMLTYLHMYMYIFFSFLFQFRKLTLIRLNVRLHESKLLYPVYDENGKIVEVIHLNANEGSQDSQGRPSAHLNKKLVYGLQSIRSTADNCDELFVVDSIPDAIVIFEELGKPCLVINSIEAFNLKA
jgi:hypothetical protein